MLLPSAITSRRTAMIFSRIPYVTLGVRVVRCPSFAFLLPKAISSEVPHTKGTSITSPVEGQVCEIAQARPQITELSTLKCRRCLSNKGVGVKSSYMRCMHDGCTYAAGRLARPRLDASAMMTILRAWFLGLLLCACKRAVALAHGRIDCAALFGIPVLIA